MANASNKRIAQSNAQALRGLRQGMVIVNFLPLLLHLLLSLPLPLPLFRSHPFSRILSPLYPSSIFSFGTLRYLITTGGTVWIWRYFERIGAGGQDLGEGGVVELGWDVIYITWACVVLSALFGSKVWWLYLAAPAIAVYKTYTFIAPFLFSRVGGPGATAVPASSSTSTASNPNTKSGLKPGQKLTSTQAKRNTSAGVDAEDVLDENGDPLSKRQAKLKARAERGDKRVQQQERRK